MDTSTNPEEANKGSLDFWAPTQEEWSDHLSKWHNDMYNEMMATNPEDVHRDPHPPPGSKTSQEDWDAYIKHMKWNYWCSINPREHGAHPTDKEWAKIPDNSCIATCRPTFKEDMERYEKYKDILAEEMKKASEMPLPDDEDCDYPPLPTSIQYVSGETVILERHQDPEKRLYYFNPRSKVSRPNIVEGQFFISKIPETMDKLFISDGTPEGGIPCVKHSNGAWGRGEAPSASEVGGAQE